MIPIEDLQSVLLECREGVSLNIQVKPGAARSRLRGVREGRLVVDIRQKALEGEANEALIAFIASLMGTSKSGVELIRGARSRKKTLYLHMSRQEALQALAGAVEE